MGRSGTAFLGSVLNICANTAVCHEYIGNRNFWLLSWYLQNTNYSSLYLKDARRKIDAAFSDVDVFIDVNGYLQHCGQQLFEEFPNSTVLHLVRDPREVVRSISQRRSASDLNVLPKDSSELADWKSLSDFEKICWNWADVTMRLCDLGVPVIRFENLMSDYDYFLENVCARVGCHVTQDTWQKAVSTPVNKTKSRLYRELYTKFRKNKISPKGVAHFTKWNSDQQSSFRSICGEAAERVGYQVL